MDISRQDLREVAADLKAYIGERVDRVEATAGRIEHKVNKHDRELADHNARLENLEQPAEDVLADADQKPAITKRDLKVLGGLVFAVGLLVETTHKLWSFAAELLKTR